MAINTRAAYTAHAAIEVSGTYDSYGGRSDVAWSLDIRDIDDIPDTKALIERLESRTPRPVMFPVFFENTASGSVPTTTVGTGDVNMPVSFLCCVEKPRVITEAFSTIGPNTVDVHDAYITALFSNPDLDDELAGHLQVTTEIGVWPWLEGAYAGFRVNMVWQFLVG